MSHARFCMLGNISIDDLVFEDGSTMWKTQGGNSIYATLGSALWRERPLVIAPVVPRCQDIEPLMPDKAPQEALRVLGDLARELPIIAIKRGERGVLMHAVGAKDYLEIPSVAGQVVDATGAGDAFCGGALVGYAQT